MYPNKIKQTKSKKTNYLTLQTKINQENKNLLNWQYIPTDSRKTKAISMGESTSYNSQAEHEQVVGKRGR